MYLATALSILDSLLKIRATRLAAMTPEDVRADNAKGDEVIEFFFGWVKKLRGTLDD
jgi:hypothetical protein